MKAPSIRHVLWIHLQCVTSCEYTFSASRPVNTPWMCHVLWMHLQYTSSCEYTFNTLHPINAPNKKISLAVRRYLHTPNLPKLPQQLSAPSPEFYNTISDMPVDTSTLRNQRQRESRYTSQGRRQSRQSCVLWWDQNQQQGTPEEEMAVESPRTQPPWHSTLAGEA